MARTAPAPNAPAIPGMNPGVFVMGGGGGSGSGSGNGSGNGTGQGGDGDNGGSSASGGGKSACGSPGQDGGGCPNHHGGRSSGSVAQGDPVDVITGRVFTIPEVDLRLPGPLPLVFTRTYSTAARDRNVGLGFGWTHAFSWEIELRWWRCSVWTAEGTSVDFGSLTADAATLGPDGWLLHREGEGFVLDLPGGGGYTEVLDPVTSHRCGQMFEHLGITDCVVGAKGVRGEYGVYKPKKK